MWWRSCDLITLSSALFFSATCATLNIHRPGRREAFYLQNQTDVNDLGSLAHDFTVMLNFLIFHPLPTRGQRQLMHRESYLSGFHASQLRIASLTNGWSRQPLLCVAYLTVASCAFRMQLISRQCRLLLWNFCAHDILIYRNWYKNRQAISTLFYRTSHV